MDVDRLSLSNDLAVYQCNVLFQRRHVEAFDTLIEIDVQAGRKGQMHELVELAKLDGHSGSITLNQ